MPPKAEVTLQSGWVPARFYVHGSRLAELVGWFDWIMGSVCIWDPGIYNAAHLKKPYSGTMGLALGAMTLP
jgi:hypothetical protein